jgi:hypothetical protein
MPLETGTFLKAPFFICVARCEGSLARDRDLDEGRARPMT